MFNLLFEFITTGFWHPALEAIGLGLDSPVFDIIVNLW